RPSSDLLVRREIRSYRELPKNLYQIQVKFRDEIRPRFGLMRGREFLMKDAYSFHVDADDARREYRNMFDAYTRIFERCGLTFRAVEAGTGTIGGSLSHEFQVLAASGEDAIVSCQRCGYAANVEKAEVRPVPASHAAGGPLERVATPGKRSVEEVSAFLGLPPERFIKTLLYRTAGGEVLAVLVRGDHEASGTKVQAALGGEPVTLADEDAAARATGAPVGFAGPVGPRVHVVADASLRGVACAVRGGTPPGRGARAAHSPCTGASRWDRSSPSARSTARRCVPPSSAPTAASDRSRWAATASASPGPSRQRSSSTTPTRASSGPRRSLPTACTSSPSAWKTRSSGRRRSSSRRPSTPPGPTRCSTIAARPRA